MGNMVKIELIVDVGKDPIEGRTDGGVPVINFRAAESYHIPGKDGGESRKVTSWYDVSVFGEDLAKAARFLKKGSKVFIEGRPRVKTFAGWIGIAVNARRIVLLDHKPAETVPEETVKVAEGGALDYYVQASMDNDVEMMVEEAVGFSGVPGRPWRGRHRQGRPSPAASDTAGRRARLRSSPPDGVRARGRER